MFTGITLIEAAMEFYCSIVTVLVICKTVELHYSRKRCEELEEEITKRDYEDE